MNKQDNTRLYATVVICAGILFVWQRWFMPKPPVSALGDGGSIAMVDGGAAPVAAAGIPSPTPAVLAPSSQPGEPRPPEQLVEFDSAGRHLTFTSYGGALKSAVLKGEQFKKAVAGKDQQVDLVQLQPGEPLPFSTQIAGGLPPFAADLPYAVERTDDSVTFTGRVGDLTLVKRYTVPVSGYDVALQVELRNAGGQPVAGNLEFTVDTFVAPGSEKSSSFFSRGPVNQRRPTARVDKDTQRQDKDKDGKPATYSGALHFLGVDEQYFLAALYPVGDAQAQVTLSTGEDGFRKAQASFPVSIGAGGATTRTYGIFIGPKSKEALETAGSTLPALKAGDPQLSQAIEYGMLEVICSVLLLVLRFFHGVVPNWGVDIVLLTLAVKIVTLPLTMRQMAQAERMRKLQPEMDALKKKYADDKERQNAETMKLYQQSGVNPLSGCLPLLVQMPIFWGLYKLLEYAFDIYRQPFIHGWVNDLSAQDPSYVLPGLLIVSMFASQSMMPAMGDPAQQKMMKYVMPVMFGAFMINLPAGLSLYYVFNNVLNIAQQLWLRRKFPNSRPPSGTKTSKLATA